MTEKWQNRHIIWVACWGEINFTALCSEMGGFIAINIHIYLTSPHKSPVEPRTFLLWGDGTNHRVVLPQTVEIWVFQGAKPNHPGRPTALYSTIIVARMQLLPPVTRRPGYGDFLCATHAWENRKERCWEWEKGSGRAVNACVQPRYYLYLSPSSVTDVAHHLSSLFPGGVTLTESQVQTTLSRAPLTYSTAAGHRRRCCFVAMHAQL